MSWCRHCLCLFSLLCTRGKYWSVWLIIPTMIFTQETLHGLRPLASTINRCQRRAEADICHGDWRLTRAEFFTHFLMTSPVAWPVSGAALEIAEGRDCKYQLITEIPHADRRSGASQLASTLHILQLNLQQPLTRSLEWTFWVDSEIWIQVWMSPRQYVDYRRMTSEIDIQT